MTRRLVALILSLALAAPAHSVAQETGDSSRGQREAPETAQEGSSSIVVNGKRTDVLSEAEQRTIANRFVGKLTAITPFDALPLYEPDVYCPAVIGMVDRVNTQVKERMHTVAQAAGIEPAPSGCLPSALVIFVDDKKAFLKEFERAHPVYFQSLKDRYWSVPNEDGPAVCWQLTQLINENGVPVPRLSHGDIETPGGAQIVTSFSGGSRIRAMTHTAIAMSVVLIERSALRGLTIEQIADYALMRTLTSVDPNQLAGSGAPTILTVLDTPMGDEAFASLTSWDMAYIRSRYEGDPNAFGARTRARIRHRVREAIGEEPAQASDMP